jgi:hypothetical protein
MVCEYPCSVSLDDEDEAKVGRSGETDLSWPSSGRKTHVVTETVTEDENGGKLGFVSGSILNVPALTKWGTRHECAKDQG